MYWRGANIFKEEVLLLVSFGLCGQALCRPGGAPPLYTDFRVHSWKLKYEKMNCWSLKGWVFALSIQLSHQEVLPRVNPACVPLLRFCALVSGWRLRLPRTQWGLRRRARPGPRPSRSLSGPARPPWLGCQANRHGSRPAPRGVLARRTAPESPVAHSSSHLRCGPGPAWRRAMASAAAGEVAIIGR